MRSKLMGAILQFPQLIDGIPIVAGNPGHGRAAQVDTVMVGQIRCWSPLTRTRCDPARRVSIQPSRLSAANIRAALAMLRP
jgi:hypothetical protein